LRDGDVFVALVFLLRLSEVHSSGRPKSRGFLDFLSEHFPQTKSSIVAGDESPQIILP
jgi:hypothetical protein